MPKFRYGFRVNWVDTDALAVVHFSNYFRYFEKAEEEFYEHHGKKEAEVMKEMNLAFPRVDAKCTYESPLHFGDEAETELSLSRISDRSVSIDFEIRNVTEGKRAAHGSMTLVCVDTRSWKAVSIPQGIREMFSSMG